MAFIYRAPKVRDIFNNPTNAYLYESEACQQLSEYADTQSQKNPNVKKSPIKGLPSCKYSQKNHESGITNLYENFEEKKLLIKKIKGSDNKENCNIFGLIEKNNKKKQQCVFKSNSKRQVFSKQSVKNSLLSTHKYPDQKRKNVKKNRTGIKSLTTALSQAENYAQINRVPKEQNVVKNINLLVAKKNLSKLDYVPSIPSKMEKNGYVLNDQNLSYPKLICKPRFEGEKNDFPGPCDYDVENKKKIKGILKFDLMSYPKANKFNGQNMNDQSLIYQCQALIKSKEQLKMHNEKIKQWISKYKQEKINNKPIPRSFVHNKKQFLSSQMYSTQNQSSQSEYQEDSTPGPGYYDYDLLKKKNFRSKKNQFQKIFMSQCERFNEQKKNENRMQIQQHQEQSLKKKSAKKSIKFFISKLPRQFSLKQSSIAPPPGYYDPRNTIQDQIIAKVLRNSPKLFNNNIPRLQKLAISDYPGPGSYQIQAPKLQTKALIEVKNNQVDYIPSDSSQNFKESRDPVKQAENLLVNKKSPKKHKRIHERENTEILEPNYAPFLSLSPKGQKTSVQNRNFRADKLERIKQLKKLKEQPKENLYPFNSSQKSRNDAADYSASIGLYEVTSTDPFNKKSFNMYFH